jgi:small subunit ribosomal protein S12
MSTINQKNNKNERKKNFCWSPSLKANPQLRARFIKMIINTPRKPNSALRKVGKVILSNKIKVLTKIPGSGHIPQKYAVVLVEGKGHKDTPSIKYSLVRGSLECLPLFNRKSRRSVYGVPDNNKIHTKKALKVKKNN